MRLPSRRQFLQALGGGGVLGAVGSVPNAADSSIRWRRSLGADEYQLNAVTRAHDGGIVVAGRTGRTDSDRAWAAAVDARGTVQWERTYDGQGSPTFRATTRVEDGYVFAGTVGPGSHTTWVVRVDRAGVERWRRTYRQGRKPHAIAVDENGIYLCGSVEASKQWMLALAPDGTPRWSRTYGTGLLTSLGETDTGFTAAGVTTSKIQTTGTSANQTQDAALLGLDRSGTLMHRHTFGGIDDERVQSVVPVSNGAVYAGHTNSPIFSEGRYRTGLLVRVDTRGRLVWRRTPDFEELLAVAKTTKGLAVVGIAAEGPPFLQLSRIDRWGRERRQFGLGQRGWTSGLQPVGDGDVIVASGGARGPWAVRVDLSQD